ncbi:hypothetical protein [Lacibacter sp. H407]|uniref:hypothetical protein n=1 Tax=Lacibacter sp. H407 TaxID=3133423 RepID=UPI0030C21470
MLLEKLIGMPKIEQLCKPTKRDVAVKTAFLQAVAIQKCGLSENANFVAVTCQIISGKPSGMINDTCPIN